MSPRPSVRLAAVDAHGAMLNEYTGHRRLTGDEPDRPWAVYLAGTDRRFRLLGFDLDAKTAGAAAAAATMYSDSHSSSITIAPCARPSSNTPLRDRTHRTGAGVDRSGRDAAASVELMGRILAPGPDIRPLPAPNVHSPANARAGLHTVGTAELGDRSRHPPAESCALRRTAARGRQHGAGGATFSP